MTDNEQLKKARTMALVLGSSSIIALLSMIYAFVQSGMAKEKEKLAVSTLIQLEECQKRANFNEQRAMVAEHKAIMQMENAERAMAEALRSQKKSK